MRCKVGDLAIVAKSRFPSSPNVGKLVRVVRLYDGRDCPITGKPYVIPIGEDWIVESEGSDLAVHLTTGTIAGYCHWNVHSDANLRPIRPGGIEDETPESLIKELCNERQF